MAACVGVRAFVQVWYHGFVEAHDAHKRRHRLRWEDGTSSWVDDLKDEEYRLAEKPPKQSGNKGSGSSNSGNAKHTTAKSPTNKSKQRASPKPHHAKAAAVNGGSGGTVGGAWSVEEDARLIELQRISPNGDWEEKMRLLGTGEQTCRLLSLVCCSRVLGACGPRMVCARLFVNCWRCAVS
jgi:hypothetical protein